MNIADSLSRGSTHGYIENNIVRKNGKRWSDVLTSWMTDCFWIVNQRNDRYLHQLRLGNDCRNESTYNIIYILHVWLMTEGVSAMHQTSMAWRHLHRKDDIWPIVKTHWGKQLGKESNFNSQNWKRKCENKKWNHGIDTLWPARIPLFVSFYITLLDFSHT